MQPRLIENGEDIYIVSKMLNHKACQDYPKFMHEVPDVNRAKAATKHSVTIKLRHMRELNIEQRLIKD
jgi:hypothetical protein